MKDKRITVVYKQPELEPKLVVMENSLRQMQDLIGGYIEIGEYICKTRNEALVIVCDEEGKLKKKEPNILSDHGAWIDVIVGPVFAAKISGEEFADMTETEAQVLMTHLREAAFYG